MAFRSEIEKKELIMVLKFLASRKSFRKSERITKLARKVKTMQKLDREVRRSLNKFQSENSHDLDNLEVFTTRPDTIFGMSFCAISPNYPLAKELAQNSRKIRLFIEECNAS